MSEATGPGGWEWDDCEVMPVEVAGYMMPPPSIILRAIQWLLLTSFFSCLFVEKEKGRGKKRDIKGCRWKEKACMSRSC